MLAGSLCLSPSESFLAWCWQEKLSEKRMLQGSRGWVQQLMPERSGQG